MNLYVVKSGEFNGIFFDEDNMKLALGNHPNPEFQLCTTKTEAINYYGEILGKVYPVSNGRIVGIFTNWPDCQTQTNGYPSAKFFSTYSLDEAIDAVCPCIENIQPQQQVSDIPTTGCIAYVDGSFNVKTSTYGWGVVLFTDGVQNEISGCGNDQELASLRNVAGEIIATKCAIQEAILLDHQTIDIYYDYEGIEKWATGEWKRKKKQTIEYYNFIKNASSQIKINFHKVKSHTNVQFNELADKLAKEACNQE